MNAERRNQIDDLLADRATQGLSAAEAASLASAAAPSEAGAMDATEHAAAAAMLADLPVEASPRSARLKAAMAAERFIADRGERPARASLGLAGGIADQRPAPRSGAVAGLGWLAAAAALGFAALSWFPRGTAPAPGAPLTFAEVVRQPDHVRWDWNDGNVPGTKQVGGEVAFSPGKAAGYMTFDRLPPLDPSREQYQLWIFDGDRSLDHPVDGGVFDAPPAKPGEKVVVPIRAHLPVGKPVMFAVTVERRGGVVVSDRSKIAVLAKPG